MSERLKTWWHIYYGCIPDMDAYCTTVYGDSAKPPHEVAAEHPTDRNGHLHYICSVDYDPDDYSGAESLVAQNLYDRLYGNPGAVCCSCGNDDCDDEA